MTLQDVLILMAVKDLADGGQAEAHVLEGRDPSGDGKLGLPVIAVAGIGVDPHGTEQADLIIVAQHTDTDSGQF